MQISNYEVKILINGVPANEYLHGGEIYIEGRKNTEFSIKVKNNGYERIVAVPTVDGLSVMDGKLAKYDSMGYIIEGYGSVTIKGWRTSDKDVASFYFCGNKESYAHKTGNDGNQGVIGVAVFKEKVNYTCTQPFYTTTFTNTNGTCGTVMPFNQYAGGGGGGAVGNPNTMMCNSTTYSGNSGATVKSYTAQSLSQCSEQPRGVSVSSIGTGWGESKKSEVIKSIFSRQDSPDGVFTIYYGERADLKKWGVDMNLSKPQYISAFPLEDNGYCKPPKK